MQNQDYSNMEPMGGCPMNAQAGMPDMMQNYNQPAVNPFMDSAMMNMAVYPEIYYKLMPFIAMTVDLLFSYGMMPTQEQLEEVTDGIFDDFITMYPDMADYMGASGTMAAFAADPPFRGEFMGGDEFRGGFRPSSRFRRGGLGRDLINVWLLSQLLGGF